MAVIGIILASLVLACSQEKPLDILDSGMDLAGDLPYTEGSGEEVSASLGFPEPPSSWDAALAIARGMDNSTLASQVIMVGLDGNGSLAPDMVLLLRASPPGGVMLFRHNLNVPKERIGPFLQTLSGLVESASGVVPFIAVDHEGGQVHRFSAEVSRLPAPLRYWEAAQATSWQSALDAVEQDAYHSAVELRSLGITLNFAPIAEALTEENAAFLEDRSYGPNPAFVETAVSAFIRGMERGGIACVVKHFPGNSRDDPHRFQTQLRGDRETLEELIRPMGGIIKTREAQAVMVSHALLPGMDPLRIASLSPVVIQEWLRGELGFSGLVIADDFSMASVEMRPEQAAVESLYAGVDMVMAWPMNIRAIHSAILAALDSGQLTRARLEEAVARIIQLKLEYCVQRSDD